MKIKSISFTDNGTNINQKIVQGLSQKGICVDSYISRLIRKNQSLSDWVENGFKEYDVIIFIGAVGIAVRLIAKFIKSKDKDPAIIVCDEKGQFVIPILSGHIGRGNEIANLIAEILNGKAIITTATDLNNIWAVDCWATKNRYLIEDISKIKYISSALLKNQEVGITSQFKIVGELPKNVVIDKNKKNGIVISPFNENVYQNNLNIIPKCIYLGVGSRKNANENALVDLFQVIKEKLNLNEKSIIQIGTIDIKKNERAIIKLAEKLNVQISFFNRAELQNVDGEFSSSEFVKSVVGVDNVCERACIKLGGDKLILKKTKGDGVTIAVAIKEEVIRF